MYKCPLCNQEVDAQLYGKITGLWEERRRIEADLKLKSAKLIERERKLRESFAEQKKSIVATEREKLKNRLSEQKTLLLAQIQKERQFLRKKRRGLAAEYNKKLVEETQKIVEAQKAHLQDQHDKLKKQFQESARIILEREKGKIEAEKTRLEKKERVQINRFNMLNKQYNSLQQSSTKELEKRNQKIKSLEEQIKSSQTPQVLGLLEENVFLARLQEMFQLDKFDHTGKGGDIVHHIIEANKEVGIIVYELKKVSKFNTAHIEQTFLAKQQRKADYGILVTNAKRNSKDPGFSLSREIIIIHPAAAPVLVSILRDQVISISRLKLSKVKREATINAVLEYIQSPAFKNSIQCVIQDTVDLYEHMNKEVKDHISNWEFRLSKYRDIHTQTRRIEGRVVNLISVENNPQKMPKLIDIKPIELPPEIE